jgi:serine-type D-Ala-D-Ala carboxypeptidase/endopeptidase (penicillin-binding protein 4)
VAIRFFVWEEAIALGNTLNNLDIRQIKGNLLVTDKFYMNYNSNAERSAQLLQQALDYRLWNAEISQQYLTLANNTPRPQVTIEGETQIISQIPQGVTYQFTHQSLPLSEILKQMNIYSNNYIAQMLADFVGGASQVAAYTAKITQVDPKEIQLINGSGLGEENRLSPRAVCKMLVEIDRLLQPYNLQVSDLFPVAGRDRIGTIKDRQLPLGTTIKTGTLDRVSALAGAIDTEDRGRVWFAIVNNGREVDYFRQQQDRLLQNLVQNWQLRPQNFTSSDRPTWYLGDPKRNRLSLNSDR